jgi:organic radical activating enzyme
LRIERLDLPSKALQPFLRKSIQQVANGGRLSAPIAVDLDPTTFCDLECPGCISESVLNNGRFTRERLLAIADELASIGVKAVVFIGGGEPLMHPATVTAAEILHGRGVQVGLVTNGTLLDRYTARLARCMAWTRVSVDAGTPETYAMFRPSRHTRNMFVRVIANMRELAAVKHGELGYSFLVNVRGHGESNIPEIAIAAEQARNIGCDYFEIKAAMVDSHHIAPLPDGHREQLMIQVAEARKLQRPGFAVELSSSLHRLLAGAELDEPKDYHRCAVAELRTLITPTGAFVCSYHRGNPRMRIGDPLTSSIADLWSTARTDVVDPSRDCRFHCARHPINLRIAEDPGDPAPCDSADPFI